MRNFPISSNHVCMGDNALVANSRNSYDDQKAEKKTTYKSQKNRLGHWPRWPSGPWKCGGVRAGIFAPSAIHVLHVVCRRIYWKPLKTGADGPRGATFFQHDAILVRSRPRFRFCSFWMSEAPVRSAGDYNCEFSRLWNMCVMITADDVHVPLLMMCVFLGVFVASWNQIFVCYSNFKVFFFRV